MEQRKNYDKNKTHDFSFYNRFILEIETRIFWTPHLSLFCILWEQIWFIFLIFKTFSWLGFLAYSSRVYIGRLFYAYI